MDITKMGSKKVTEKNREDWDSLPILDMHADTNLVQVGKRLFGNAQNRKLLYIGFGEGQNLPHLIDEGFAVYGTEISLTRLQHAETLLRNIGKSAKLTLVDSPTLPFENNYFDVVLAWQSLSYNTERSFKESLREIERVLRPGAMFLSSVLSPKQTLLAHTKIAPHTYHPAEETGQSSCFIYAFDDEKHIETMYKNFHNIRIGYYSSELFRSPNFHWVIYCEKK